MEQPLIITIARETGSGGLEIAKKLSATFQIPYYDRDLLRMASDVSGINEELFGKADERIGWKEMIFSAKKVYTGEILPPDDDDYISTRNLFSFQAKVIKEIAKEDRRRSAYYHYYTGEEWRDVAGYDLCLDTSKYGIDGCVEKVKKAIEVLF